MRPARKGPENRVTKLLPDKPTAASMRPARKGPENLKLHGVRLAELRAGFNEAGPQGAGKPSAAPSTGRA